MSDFTNVEILLVEDNELDAEMTMRALKRGHFVNKLFWVRDGVEALEFVRCTGPYKDRDTEQLPKLVLVDIKLPRRGGLEVVRELKSEERTRLIPVVALTSSNQERDVVEAYRLGVNGYVTKPVHFAEFTDALAKIGRYWLMLNKVP